jgi:hypothetical protein
LGTPLTLSVISSILQIPPLIGMDKTLLVWAEV